MNKEIALARHCLEFALSEGAEKVRITLTRSLMDLVGVLNGEVDKVAHALDRSMQIQLFVDGKFGTFSSNCLEQEGLEAFIREAIGTVRMLEEDRLRDLPAPSRLAKDAKTGLELGLYDETISEFTPEKRRAIALESMTWPRKTQLEKGFVLISEEGEYSDSVFDSYTIDSQGLEARHTETSFEIGYETTIQDSEGNHLSSYWWDAAPFFKDLKWQDCAVTALRRAAAQIGPGSVPSGKYNLIVDSECASKLVTPLLNALGGYALQQNNSFLADSLGKKVFSDNLTITDRPRTAGQTGSRLFDSEGVATKEMAIISQGVVKTYFLNTYMAAKMEMAPTVEDATRICVSPYGGCISQEDVLSKVGDGILVTGFNGGNSNSATGNFSYGIEGFVVKDGKIGTPVREMLITGNFIDLWNKLTLAADDARSCMSKQIPTLAFRDIDFAS